MSKGSDPSKKDQSFGARQAERHLEEARELEAAAEVLGQDSSPWVTVASDAAELSAFLNEGEDPPLVGSASPELATLAEEHANHVQQLRKAAQRLGWNHGPYSRLAEQARHILHAVKALAPAAEVSEG